MNQLTGSTYYDSNNQPTDWFTESFTYDKMGNIKTLGRMGASSPIDNLTLTYTGNQLKKVDDLFGSLNQYNIKEYNNRANQSVEFGYDVNGNMIMDLDRDIVTIQYNSLNLPDVIQFRTGDKIVNTYDAGGQKLKSEYYTYLLKTSVPLILSAGDINPMSFSPGIFNYTGTAYITNKEYACSKLYVSPAYTNSYLITKLHNPEGYLSNPGGYAEFYSYYRKDHLGNNREVWQAPFMLGSTPIAAQTSQVTQYYPSGLPWASNSTDYPDRQPYKYNGKEFVEMGGLNAYDSKARWYFPDYNQTSTLDPLCEKYYSISPYAWCAGNPVNRFDPDGMDWDIWTKRDKNGNITYHINVSGVVYNNSSTNYTDKQMNQLADQIKSEANSIFNTSGDGYSVDFNMNLNVAKSINDIKSTDHVFQIVDQNEIGKDVNGNSEVSGLNIKLGTSIVSDILKGGNNRTATHEFGHSGGLHDANLPEYKEESNSLGII